MKKSTLLIDFDQQNTVSLDNLENSDEAQVSDYQLCWI